MFGNGGNLPFKGRFREEDWGGGEMKPLPAAGYL